MSVTISTDIGSQIRWQARKGNDNTLTLSVTNNSVAYDISGYTFSAYIFRWGADYTTTTNAVVSLTQGSGLTNSGASGTLTCVVTSSLLSSLLPEQYFIRFKVVHPDASVHDWINGVFILNSELWDGSASASGTIAVNLGSNTVSIALTIASAVRYPIGVAASDETTALTTGTGKVTFRMPYAFTITGVNGSLVTAQTSGTVFTFDVMKNGTTIFSTKPTFDNTERTTVTAVTPSVLSTTALAYDDEMRIDITQVGDGTAKGLKVWLLGY